MDRWVAQCRGLSGRRSQRQKTDVPVADTGRGGKVGEVTRGPGIAVEVSTGVLKLMPNSACAADTGITKSATIETGRRSVAASLFIESAFSC
jgi:hypothetical protein